jgi:molybdopterin-guanine dinucleotide biosynthesis protein A
MENKKNIPVVILCGGKGTRLANKQGAVVNNKNTTFYGIHMGDRFQICPPKEEILTVLTVII